MKIKYELKNAPFVKGYLILLNAVQAIPLGWITFQLYILWSLLAPLLGANIAGYLTIIPLVLISFIVFREMISFVAHILLITKGISGTFVLVEQILSIISVLILVGILSNTLPASFAPADLIDPLFSYPSVFMLRLVSIFSTVVIVKNAIWIYILKRKSTITSSRD